MSGVRGVAGVYGLGGLSALEFGVAGLSAVLEVVSAAKKCGISALEGISDPSMADFSASCFESILDTRSWIHSSSVERLDVSVLACEGVGDGGVVLGLDDGVEVAWGLPGEA